MRMGRPSTPINDRTAFLAFQALPDDPYQLIALSVQTNPCDVTELKFSFRAVIRNKTNPIG
jgi:hypothetical protein